MITVRQLAKEELGQHLDLLWSIDQKCFPRGISYSKREITDFIEHHGATTLLAEQAGEAVGFLIAHLGSKGRGHIITIDVLQEYRRSGVGKALLLAGLGYLKLRGNTDVELYVDADHDRALGLYRSAGFVPAGHDVLYVSSS